MIWRVSVIWPPIWNSSWRVILILSKPSVKSSPFQKNAQQRNWARWKRTHPIIRLRMIKILRSQLASKSSCWFMRMTNFTIKKRENLKTKTRTLRKKQRGRGKGNSKNGKLKFGPRKNLFWKGEQAKIMVLLLQLATIIVALSARIMQTGNIKNLGRETQKNLITVRMLKWKENKRNPSWNIATLMATDLILISSKCWRNKWCASIPILALTILLSSKRRKMFWRKQFFCP